MKGINKKDLLLLVKAAVKDSERIVDLLKGDSNPQVIAVRDQARGQLWAYRAVQSALEGDTLILKIDAREGGRS